MPVGTAFLKTGLSGVYWLKETIEFKLKRYLMDALDINL
jgi:hypothetical protein